MTRAHGGIRASEFCVLTADEIKVSLRRQHCQGIHTEATSLHLVSELLRLPAFELMINGAFAVPHAMPMCLGKIRTAVEIPGSVPGNGGLFPVDAWNNTSGARRRFESLPSAKRTQGAPLFQNRYCATVIRVRCHRLILSANAGAVARYAACRLTFGFSTKCRLRTRRFLPL